jgi:hypothetical protein
MVAFAIGKCNSQPQCTLNIVQGKENGKGKCKNKAIVVDDVRSERHQLSFGGSNCQDYSSVWQCNILPQMLRNVFVFTLSLPHIDMALNFSKTPSPVLFRRIRVYWLMSLGSVVFLFSLILPSDIAYHHGE